MLWPFAILVLSNLIQDVYLVNDDDEPEEENLSKPIVHATLITLSNLDSNCTLRIIDKRYPLK